MSHELAHSVVSIELEIERRAIVGALRSHPEWRLSDLELMMASRGRQAELLRLVTVADLQDRPVTTPPLRQHQLTRAMRLNASDLDRVVLEIVAKARDWVSCGYVLARTGGPRWRVQHALVRLANGGQLKRRGNRSATRYRVGRPAN